MKIDPRLRKYLLLIIFLFIARFFLYFVLNEFSQDYPVIKYIFTLVVLLSGLSGFYFYAKLKTKSYAFIGIGLSTVAILDTVHILIETAVITNLSENAAEFAWDLSSTILALTLVGSWFLWERDDIGEENIELQREIAERKRAEAAEAEQRRLAEALLEVSNALNATLDLDKLMENLLVQIADVLPYNTANVMVLRGEQVEIVASKGYGEYSSLQRERRYFIRDMKSIRRMMETGEPLIIPDTAVNDLWFDAEGSPHVKSWAGAPITVKGDLVAFLALNNDIANSYQPEQEGRLTAFASQAAIAFENARLYEEVNKRVDELTSLYEISQAVTSTLDLEETLTIITESIKQRLHVDAASVGLVSETSDNIWFAAASGKAAEYVKGKRIAMGQGIIGWVAKNGEPLSVLDTSKDERHFADFDNKSGFQAQAILCVPLIAKGQTIGAMEAINKIDGTFDEEDLRLLTRLVGPATTAIDNARLFEQAQQEIIERKRAEAALEAERSQLARRVDERTADLQAANAELARAARLKDEFLASMSHELRTPLNAVLGISEALQEGVYGPLNEKQIGSLGSIEESGRHLLALINDILDLSKVEAGKLNLQIVPVQVESICQASLRIIKQDAHKKRLKVHTSFDSAVTTVRGDERRVKQILVNLLSNAVKFTPEEGEIGLEVVGDNANMQVHITVWDSGIGISDSDQERLFQPFVQLDSRLSREYAGTGLGLSLVSRMMALHEGTIRVQSEVGVGSRFTVTFPWQGAELSEGWEREDEFQGIPNFSVLRYALLVEDSPTATAQLTRYMREVGVDVLPQTHGSGAVAQAIKIQPDVIILDILLPDVSGWDILQALKAEERTKDIPVMVVSVIDERERAMAAGATACLLKPIKRGELYDILRHVVAQKEMSRNQEAGELVVMDTAVSEPSGNHHPSPAQEKETAVPTKPRILLAEDNEHNITTFSSYLNAKGFDVSVVRNGIEAVAYAKSELPNLIIMDIQMPQMNGLDAIRHIRDENSTRNIPIIAVTALAMPGDEEACIRAGANAYLSKPVSLAGLVGTIKEQLAQV